MSLFEFYIHVIFTIIVFMPWIIYFLLEAFGVLIDDVL